MKIDTDKLTIKDARTMLDEGGTTSLDLTRAYLKRIEEENDDINAYLGTFDDAEESAKEADKVIKSKKNIFPLTGIPLAVKDNILVKGKRCGSASKILEGYTAPYDATVISKLRLQKAVFLGRTNMDEFAMGSSTENSAYGVTKNPLNLSRVSGGSSGGSAAAVAMGAAAGALGSDTGGSVRQPASFCGLVGMKPTYGAVSRFGLMAMGSSLDQIGPITKTVFDAGIMFNAIRGEDRFDGTTFSESAYPRRRRKEKYTLGIPRAFTEQDGMDVSVRENFKKSIDLLRSAGFEIKDIVLPNLQYSLAVYYIVMPAEASTNLSRFDGIRFGSRISGDNLMEDNMKTRGGLFGKEVRRRIVLGTHVLSSGYYDAYYGKAQAVRSIIRNEFNKVFESGIDCVVMPTTPSVAFKIGEKVSNPVEMYLGDIFTVTANIAKIPAISVPSGFVKTGDKSLPLGIQFMTGEGQDDVMLDIAESFEKVSVQ